MAGPRSPGREPSRESGVRDLLAARPWTNRFFRWDHALLLGLAILALVAVGHVVAIQVYQALGVTKFTRFWPFNTVYPHVPTPARLLPALLACALLAASLFHAARRGFRLGPVLLAAFATIFAATLVQGWYDGFIEGIYDGGSPEEGGQYYWDALEIEDPVAFVARFNELQPDLRIHSQTHPPGSVLVFWVGHQALGDPAYVSIAMGVVSVLVSGLALHAILRRLHPGDLPAYGVLLYFVFPAVQIYSLASTDALIASLFLAALAFHLHPDARIGVPGAALALSLAAFMTFLAGFAAALLAFHALWTRTRLSRTALTLGLLGVFLLALRLGLGYDYYESFRLASRIENPEGFRLLADPAGYLLSRAMGLLELLVFVGPVLLLVARRGLPGLRARRPDVWALVLGSALLTALLFAAGVFRTGETARAALFLQPFLLFAVLEGASDAEAGFRERAVLLATVFLQALGMQVLGEWFW